jgi:transcriptional regulator with GAF, ATPase, and Fis domain
MEAGMTSAAYQFRSVCTEGAETYRSLDEEFIGLSELVSTSMFEEIVGSSDAINRVTDQILKVAPFDATVLITGASGTGKELIARAIHRKSNRSGRPLICMNCAATPPSLIATELFGHEKGAFTDANQFRAGRFEIANHGTLFLDEIGDMPIEAQCAMLRVLQEHQLERVGGSRTIPVDVRVIAATNCDLSAAIESGRFRLDLFYRLNIFPIHVPSLRERPEDILPLAKYFIERYAAKGGKRIRNIDKRTAQLLEAYSWPGNIRELQNVIERSVILCDTETLSVDEEWVQSESELLLRRSIPTSQEKQTIEAALEESRGRISGSCGAAARLGIPRTTLEARIKRLTIDKYKYQFAGA